MSFGLEQLYSCFFCRENNYSLNTDTDLGTSLFTGRVIISIMATYPTSYFLVHTKDLAITNTSLQDQAGDSVVYRRVFEYEKNEFWVVELEQEAGAGNYSLSLEFRGNLTQSLTGFYKSVYTNSQGQKVPIATSQFQPTYAGTTLQRLNVKMGPTVR